jgi:hypothetical protein
VGGYDDRAAAVFEGVNIINDIFLAQENPITVFVRA